MKPYFEENGISIYLGDCREVLPTISPIDLLIADPPYAETSLEWDRKVDGWQEIAFDAAAPNASLWCFGSFRFFWNSAVQFHGWKFAQDLVWEKHNGSGLQSDRFKRVHELIAQFYKGKWEYVFKQPQFTADATERTVRRKFRPPHMGVIGRGAYRSFDGGPRMMRSVIQQRSCHGSAEHPTQKPADLLAPIIGYSAAPGAVIVDPFAGSGSTAVACKALHLPCALIEIEERYCEIAANRLRQSVLDLQEVV